VFLYSLSCVLAQEQDVEADVTFYAFGDNCPPSGDVAYPRDPDQPSAGGVGSFDDPITYAGATDATPPGTIVYVPNFQKYFIMEDDCEECAQDWQDGNYHIDLWLGPPDTIQTGTTDCENALSFRGTITLFATSGKTENSTQFFSDGNCAVPVDPCVDKGNDCGNECQIPSSMSCEDAANLLFLPFQRFQQLNPDLDCSSDIPSDTSVCQSGSCGGP